MTIVPFLTYELEPREEVFNDIMTLIEDAAYSDEDVNVYELAREILSTIEPRINSINAEGEVIYR